MSVVDEELQAAIAEAVEQSGLSNDDFDLETTSVDPPATEANTDKSDDLTKGKETEGEATVKIPEEYWGTSLEGLSDEQRAAVIAALEQRDSQIYKLQQKLAEEPKTPEPVTEDPPAEVTDDDILAFLGIDKETADPTEVEYAMRFSVPLARQLMALEDTVQGLAKTEEYRETASFWNTTLDSLEGQYGKLPGDRLSILRYAAEEGIGDPEVLYHRVHAPLQKELGDTVAKTRTAAKKAAAGGLRPRSTTAGDKTLETDGKSLRDVVKEAAIQAQEESGVKWSSILKPR